MDHACMTLQCHADCEFICNASAGPDGLAWLSLCGAHASCGVAVGCKGLGAGTVDCILHSCAWPALRLANAQERPNTANVLACSAAPRLMHADRMLVKCSTCALTKLQELAATSLRHGG